MRYYYVLIGLFVLVFSSYTFQLETTPYQFPELKFFPKLPQSAQNKVTVEGAQLGRYLFYDPILSGDSTMACASCHIQKYAFSDAPKQYSTGRNGSLMQRNTLALFNLAWFTNLFWDGRANSIEEQVYFPLRTGNEMNLNWVLAAKRLAMRNFYRKQFKLVFGTETIDSVQISYAIGQFLRTLLSYQSKYDSVLAGYANFTKDEFEGFNLINDQTRGDCLHCHFTDGNALGTNVSFSNNGLDAIEVPTAFSDKGRGVITGKLADYGKFKVPSLRNLLYTAPYMHDGRFKTLEEVIDFYSTGVKKSSTVDSRMEFVHQGGAHLTSDEKRKIVAFLRTLSDRTFIVNPAFSNPFTQ